MYMYIHITYMHVMIMNEKGAMSYKKIGNGIWEDLEGRRGREKCYNYIILSKNWCVELGGSGAHL